MVKMKNHGLNKINVLITNNDIMVTHTIQEEAQWKLIILLGIESEAIYQMPNPNTKVKCLQIWYIHILFYPYNKTLTDWIIIGTYIRASTTLNSYLIHTSRIKNMPITTHTTL